MAAQERSIADVLQDILRNIQEIVRSEVRLAKSELGDEFTKVKASAPLLVVGAVAGSAGRILSGMGSFLCSVTRCAQWAAALIVAGVLAIVGGMTLSAGVKALQRVHPPEQTIASVKENVQWAKQQVK